MLIPMSAVMFVWPQYIGELKLVGIPGLLAEVATALWLLVKGLGPGAAPGDSRESSASP